MTETQRYLLAIRDEDETQTSKVQGAGDLYRARYKRNAYTSSRQY